MDAGRRLRGGPAQRPRHHLNVNGLPLGALNLYSQRVDAFAIEDRASAKAFAAHVAVAVQAATDNEQKDAAMVHRLVIGQAEGMLMQGFQLTEEQAFAALLRVSQHRNIKLTEVAVNIVKDGIRSELFAYDPNSGQAT